MSKKRRWCQKMALYVSKKRVFLTFSCSFDGFLREIN